MIAAGALLAGAVFGTAGFQAWGDAPFALAASQGKPVLLVAGDLACQECPEARAFAEPMVATALGERFVPVAVDRLERPDVDDLYRTASSLLPDAPQLPPGPVLFLLTPERRPFAAAPLDAGGLAGFLAHQADEFATDRSAAESRAGVVTAALRASVDGEAAVGPLGEDVPARALKGLRDAGRVPLAALRLLVEEQQRRGDGDTLRLLKSSLDGLARGGIGEPRLADAALLLRASALAHDLTGEARYRELAEGLAAFGLRELGQADGSFGAGPGDDRVFAGLNGLMISGLAASGRRADLETAGKAAAAVLQRLGPPALLRRFARGDDLGGSAFLEDYAFLAEGLLDLADADGERRFVDDASALVAAATARFLDADRGGFFDTDDRHGALPVRVRNGYDGERPSANGVMASALLKLARATGEARHAAMARRTVEAFLGDLQKAPRGMETLAAVAGELLGRGEATPASDSPLPSRVVKGPVTVEAMVAPARVRSGAALEARVTLTIAPGHRVNGRAPGKDLVGLSVSAPGEDFVASSPRYPAAEPSYTGAVTVTLPLRVRPGRVPGEARVRVRVLFQACDARDCGTPDSALVDVPVTIVPPGR